MRYSGLMGMLGATTAADRLGFALGDGGNSSFNQLGVAGPLMGAGLSGMAKAVGVLLSPDKANRSRLDAFQELERSMSHGNFETGVMRANSTEAVDTINRSMMNQESIMEKVFMVLEAAKVLQEQQKDIEQQQLDALNAFVLKGI